MEKIVMTVEKMKIGGKGIYLVEAIRIDMTGTVKGIRTRILGKVRIPTQILH